MALPCEIIPVTRIAERPGSGKITFSKSGVSANRKWVCPWFFSDGRTYLDFVQQLLGLTIGGPNDVPIITYPDSFSPDLPYLYCQEVDVEGEDIFGVDVWGRIAYRRAILTCKYVPYERGESFHLAAQMFTCKEGQLAFIGQPTPMPPRPALIAQDQRTVMLAQINAAIEQMGIILNGMAGADPARPALQQRYNRLSDQVLQLLNNAPNLQAVSDLSDYIITLQNWYNNQIALMQSSGVPDAVYAAQNGGGNPVTVPVGKIIPLGEYTLERHFVLQPNFTQWTAMMGCTNALYFLGFPPWTLLFSGVDGKRALMPNGTRCWDITLKFLFNPNGHNMIYRAEKGRFEIVVSTVTSAGGWLTAGLTGWKVIDKPLHRYLYEPIDYAPFLNYT